MTDPVIAGVKMRAWPVEELLFLPWHMVTHLTDDDKRMILVRAEQEGVPRPYG